MESSYSKTMCVSDVKDLKEGILKQANQSRFAIHPGVTKTYICGPQEVLDALGVNEERCSRLGDQVFHLPTRKDRASGS